METVDGKSQPNATGISHRATGFASEWIQDVGSWWNQIELVIQMKSKRKNGVNPPEALRGPRRCEDPQVARRNPSPAAAPTSAIPFSLLHTHTLTHLHTHTHGRTCTHTHTHTLKSRHDATRPNPLTIVFYLSLHQIVAEIAEILSSPARFLARILHHLLTGGIA